jgi:hypothetical protein
MDPCLANLCLGAQCAAACVGDEEGLYDLLGCQATSAQGGATRFPAAEMDDST